MIWRSETVAQIVVHFNPDFLQQNDRMGPHW